MRQNVIDGMTDRMTNWYDHITSALAEVIRPFWLNFHCTCTKCAIIVYFRSKI